jgi:thioredoxin 1
LSKIPQKVKIGWEEFFVDNVITVTGDNFQSEIVQSPIPVLIDFWAPWCGPCKMIGPLIEQIAEEYTGRLKVGKVNVDEESALAEQHGVVSIPMLLLYKDGAIAAQKTGAAPKHGIEALFKNLI